MEELIFIGVLILFTIFEALARGKKGRGPVPPPEEWEPEGEEREEREPVVLQRPGPPREAPAEYRTPATYREPERPRRPEPRTSEGMVPTELWEEILQTARRRAEEGRARAREVPAPPPPRPAPPRPPAPRAPRPAPAREEPLHVVHLAHAEYGMDPSSRTDASSVGVATPRPLPDPAREARELLGGGSRSLREAMILKEVLGPPAALSADWSGSDVD